MARRIVLDTIAEEVFRDQADKDYIAARANYRMNLREQFSGRDCKRAKSI
jgi:hypothetical protein